MDKIRERREKIAEIIFGAYDVVSLKKADRILALPEIKEAIEWQDVKEQKMPVGEKILLMVNSKPYLGEYRYVTGGGGYWWFENNMVATPQKWRKI